MEGCLTFQWEGMGGGLFFCGGCTPWGALVLMGRFRKDHMGEASPPCLPTMGNPEGDT